ncbi:jg21981 [Pararge aegeria aegeria]|uniref:Jg21981 protein n=1 Tax=Pararge aegeria aegeria TaxID=348720 RepID=A0A8S4QKF2_9NEOP|nr:jg21981 [Pararge aegeria aegeria]
MKLSKIAFDCVQHETLVRKLHHYGIQGVALDLMSNYLRDRIQKVDVNGKRSNGSVMKIGVPQGSILGPFLFLIYINDLPYLAKDKHGIVLFADDTSLTFKINRRELAFDDVNNSLAKVVQWFEANNLVLNGKKTKCIKFTLPNVKHVKTTVLLNNEELKLEDTTVFLGITLDSKLQWGPHVNNLSNRLSSAAYAVKKIRHMTDVETARLVYFSYFHSIMSYGILLWGNAADISTIFVLQKRAVRSIYKMGPRESLRDKFKDFKIMTVYSQYIFENLMSSHFGDYDPHDTDKKPQITLGSRVLRTSRAARGCDARGAQRRAPAPRVTTMRRPPTELSVACLVLLAFVTPVLADVASFISKFMTLGLFIIIINISACGRPLLNIGLSQEASLPRTSAYLINPLSVILFEPLASGSSCWRPSHTTLACSWSLL